ncbi:MAG: hypothetical protein ACYCXN_02050 [Acidimicrobiales bacterium]|jgi:hypothetical protein
MRPFAAPPSPDWKEIYRVLVAAGRPFAQHVSPRFPYELIERLLGPFPESEDPHDPKREPASHGAGQVVTGLRTVRCRMEFLRHRCRCVVLRNCIRWVPGFSVDKYIGTLIESTRGCAEVGASWYVPPVK